MLKMALYVPRKYVTKKVFENAVKTVHDTGEALDFQFSPAIMIRFGTVGLTISKYFDHHIYSKHVNDWQNKTPTMINEEIAEQEWTR